MKIVKLNYFSDSAALFEQVRHLPYACLLDSHHNKTEQTNRFDIIVADPIDLLEQNHNESIDVFLIRVRNHLQNTFEFPTKQKSEYPFSYGALGYFSYDAALANQEKIKPHKKNDIHLPLSLVGIYAWSIVTDHVLKKTVLISCPSFRGALVPMQSIQSIKDRMDCVGTKVPRKDGGITPRKDIGFKPEQSSQSYADAFAKTKRHIHQGDAYQINLTQRFSAEFNGDPWLLYRSYREAHPVPFGGFFQINKSQALLTFSPERFIELRDNITTTKPIKGTAKVYEDKKQNEQSIKALLHCEKNRAENTMIVDLLRNDFGKVCEVGSIEVEKLCALESFNNVHHLVSTIKGKLADNKDAIDLIAACFPGGSITGVPKLRAMQVINELEKQHRSLYCGSLGYIDASGDMDFNILIRSIMCDGEKAYVYAGGGVVQDSTLEDEYQECFAKISHLILFADASLAPR